MDIARWAATAALAFQVALRWLRLALDVFFFGTAISPGVFPNLDCLVWNPLRQIARLNRAQR